MCGLPWLWQGGGKTAPAAAVGTRGDAGEAVMYVDCVHSASQTARLCQFNDCSIANDARGTPFVNNARFTEGREINLQAAPPFYSV